MSMSLNSTAQTETPSGPRRDAEEAPIPRGETEGRAGVVKRNATALIVAPTPSHRNQLRRSVEAASGKILSAWDLYPDYMQLASLLEAGCDAYIVEIDADQIQALELVEALCSRKPSSTVMVYSAVSDGDRMVAAMRAGAREFLSGAVAPAVLAEALGRAAIRNSELSVPTAAGQMVVFWSAKGGSGVSTLSANFAIALRAEAGEPVLLADLNPHLGDLSVLLGISSRFTVTEALKSAQRIDSEYLSTLVTEHRSGVSVVTAPDAYSPGEAIEERAVGRFLDIAKRHYPWVVIDAGPSLGPGIGAVFQMAKTIYVVTQLDIPSLRSAHRFISYTRAAGCAAVEVVINRHDPRKSEFDEERIAKALGVAAKWKVPNDYAAAQLAANTGEALMFGDSPIAYALRSMARSACGKPPQPTRKKSSWKIFG